MNKTTKLVNIVKAHKQEYLNHTMKKQEKILHPIIPRKIPCQRDPDRKKTS